MWATDPSWTHAFVSPEAISSNSITVGGATWSVSTTAGAGTPTISTGTYSKTYGLKFGNSKSEYYGSVTFTTDYFKDYNVKFKPEVNRKYPDLLITPQDKSKANPAECGTHDARPNFRSKRGLCFSLEAVRRLPVYE